MQMLDLNKHLLIYSVKVARFRMSLSPSSALGALKLGILYFPNSTHTHVLFMIYYNFRKKNERIGFQEK